MAKAVLGLALMMVASEVFMTLQPPTQQATFYLGAWVAAWVTWATMTITRGRKP